MGRGAEDRWAWRALALMMMAVAVVAAAVILWRLANVLLLVFGAILFAVLLRALSDLIENYTPIAGKWALAASGLIFAVLVVLFGVLLGSQIQAQIASLVASIPDLIDALEDRLGVSGLRQWLQDRLGSFIRDGALAGSLAGYSGTIMTAIANVVLVIFAGIYFAIDPQLYRKGSLMLFPRERREEAGKALLATAGALKLWLLGQLVAMVVVGTLTTVGLWLIGLPSALALGFIAALMEFIPFAGPVIAAVPAIALGFAESPTTGLLVLGLYLVIQSIEGNLLMPLIHERSVSLPPAITIFAILVFGVLFGPLGILLATPLAVVSFVLVKKLWVQDVLDEDVNVPGEPEDVEAAE